MVSDPTHSKKEIMEDLNQYDVGQPMNEPMTTEQRYYIESLLHNCSFNPDQKQAYERCMDCRLTYNEAEDIISELQSAQIDNISLARSGKLKQVDLGKALARIIQMDNT